MLLRSIFPGLYSSINLETLKNLLAFMTTNARDRNMVLVRNQSLVSWCDKLYIRHYAKELCLQLTASKERREETVENWIRPTNLSK